MRDVKDEDRYTLKDMIEIAEERTGLVVGAVVDLTATYKYYDPSELSHSVFHYKYIMQKNTTLSNRF